ncbi:MAG TPA: rod shape-determining protein MreD [Thermoanaerobaculia bacterium]|nr:rod shape-determining protein MreD [Thermoanaerobaculia bacterium]
MTFGRIALLLAAATALEFLVGGSRLRGFLPVDWFLLVTASVSRNGNFVRAVLTGAAAGFVEDAFSQPLFGMNAFAKAAIGYGLAMISVRIVFGGALAVGAALAAASLANDLIVGVLGALLLQAPIVLASPEALGRAAATGLAGSLLYAAERFSWREWWHKRQLRKLR